MLISTDTDALDILAKISKSANGKDVKKIKTVVEELQLKLFKLPKPGSKRKQEAKCKFRCGFCTATYNYQHLLNAHWSSMHGFLMCRRSVTCRSVFSNSVNRRVHEKAFHMNDGKWVCKTCGQRFVFLSQITK